MHILYRSDVALNLAHRSLGSKVIGAELALSKIGKSTADQQADDTGNEVRYRIAEAKLDQQRRQRHQQQDHRRNQKQGAANEEPGTKRRFRGFRGKLCARDRHLIANELGELVDDIANEFGDAALIEGAT